METKHYLSGFLAKQAPKILVSVGALFLALSLIGYKIDAHHYFHSYMTSFMFFLGLSLSSMFFVLIQFLARGGWGVVVRRVFEQLMKNIPLMAVFFIPIIFGLQDLFVWADPTAMHGHVLQGKVAYLNKPFFVGRAIGYFAIWIVIARFFFRKSVLQDDLGGDEITILLQRRSAVCILLFALTYTFASFDWVMSLEPLWYSTMFGLYTFANSTVAALCVGSLLYMLLRRFGFLKEVVTVDHFHDLGRLIYGFVIFWAYIAFSQFFLIWYANIPEETVWYLPRITGTWLKFTVVLWMAHFVIPLFLFMSRHAKRHLPFHTAIALLVTVACAMDLYFIVMPSVSDTVHITFTDVSIFLGMGGIYFALFFRNLSRYNLFPIKDPRLVESLQLETL